MKPVKVFTLLLIVSLLFLCAPTLWAKDSIQFGVLAFRPKAQTLKQWQPLASYLEQALGLPVLMTAYNYNEFEQAISNNAIDVVLTNSGNYILLKQRHALSAPLVTMVRNVSGNKIKAFGGIIFSRSNRDDIKTLKDLGDKKIAVTLTKSLGGYQMQAFELLTHGLKTPAPEQLLITEMPHDHVIDAVLSEKADIGFVRTGVLEDLVDEGSLDLTQVKIINPQGLPHFPYASSTRLYPEWPVAVMPGINEELTQRLAIALLSLPSDHLAAVSAGIHGFTTASDYSGVESMLRELRMPPFNRIENFKLIDLWSKYKYAIVVLAVLMTGLIGFMVMFWSIYHRSVLNEARFRAIFEHAAVGIAIVDPSSGKFVQVNKNYCHMLGYEPDELKQRSFNDVTHPEDRHYGMSERQQLASHDISQFTLEKRYLHKDGHLIWSNLTVSGIYDGIKHRRYHLAIIEDISERHQLMDSLVQSQIKIHEKEIQLRTLVETLPDLIWLKNPEGVYLDCNRRFEEFFGASQKEIIGKTDYDFVDKELADFFRKHDLSVIENGKPATNEERVTFASDQHEELLETTKTAMYGNDGHLIGVLGIAHDITQRKEAEQQLQLAASVFAYAGEGIMITDATGSIIDVNQAFTRITGYSRDEVVGHNPRLLNSGHHDKTFFKSMWKTLLKKGEWSGEIWNRHKNGEIFTVIQTISLVRDKEDNPLQFVSLFSDITPLKKHQKELEYIAHYDALTGLPNRVLFSDRLRQAMHQTRRRNNKIAVAFLDLDGFKAVNDNHGHDAGDLLLATLAKRMKKVLREGDTIARMGGDEFVIVLVDLTDIEACVPLLTRLLDAASEPVRTKKADLNVSASLGVTFYPQTEEVHSEQLLRQADQAMYQAKLSGKNCYQIFDNEQDKDVRNHHDSLEQVSHGLENNEFVLFYQPKVNMRTGKVIGAEALIRWQHPDKGLLLPDNFLPIIEGHQLSIDVGNWVIETALKQMEKWIAAGLSIPLSINISAEQIQQKDFSIHLLEQLNKHPLVNPYHLELEILESNALKDIVQVSEVIQSCRKIGVSIALDDFGTGYSSLTYLKSLPADVMKIDKSFVHDMLDDPEDLAILDGIMGLAESFRRNAIAEGVEKVSQGVMLLQLGCDLAQGYAIARPMPAKAMANWISHWKSDPAWTEVPALSQDNIGLLYAGVEHRAWLLRIENYLQDKTTSLPELDHNQCRFSQWLKNERLTRQGMGDQLQKIEAAHSRIHQLAHELIEHHNSDKDQQVNESITMLRLLRDDLLDLLDELIIDSNLI